MKRLVKRNRLRKSGQGPSKKKRLKREKGRKVTKEYTVFKYKDLSEEAKEKVRQKFYEWTDLTWWADDWKEQLKEKGFEDVDLSYSLGYAQGDGASFTAKSVDIETLVKSFPKLKKFKQFADGDKYYMSINIERISSHYVHENTTRANVEVLEKYAKDGSTLDLTEKEEKLLGDFEKTLNEVIYDLNRKIGESGYAEIEHQTSEEYIKDMSEANNYEYLESGELFG